MRSSVMTKLTVTILAVFLVIFTVYTLVTSRADWETSQAAQEESLVRTSEVSALEIQAVFNEAFHILQTEANLLASAYENGELQAEIIVEMKRNLLAEHESWLSNSSIFEPNIVTASTADGQRFIDASGRFVPYFIREDDGTLNETNIEAYEEEAWYVQPIQNGKTMITDPYDYEVGGETLSMVTLVVPVMTNSTAIGYVSADFSLDFLSSLVTTYAPTDGVQRVVTNSGLITADSHDASVVGENISIFSSKEEALISELTATSSTLTYEDDALLQAEVAEVVTPIAFQNIEANWGVITSMPTSIMNAPLMKQLLWSVIGAIAMACLLGATVFFVVRHMLKPLTPLHAALQKAATGDLTAHVEEAHLTNDEIGMVTRAYNDMMHKTRYAVASVMDASDEMQVETTSSAEAAESVHDGLKNSANALTDIADGSQHQADETEQSLAQVTKLSTNMETIHAMSEQMNVHATTSMNESQQGVNQIVQLRKQQQQTTTVQEGLSEEMNGLLRYVDDIGHVMDTIQSISEQTNLLALNASIEAARAGDAGKGFGVVAQEVRKLAEQSHAETEAIRQTIAAIQQASTHTAATVEESTEQLKEQAVVMLQTEEMFHNQAMRAQQLERDIAELTSRLADMVEQKDHMLNSIQTIASISEESAAATEEVTATIMMQTEEVETITQNVQHLQNISKQLNMLMQTFKIS
ncbi:MAG: methyl-accepting chemotaxis protein [Caryophanon sp.]|nr:methyl-accepting chemotaxis protein [Caryophanon sp.]